MMVYTREGDSRASIKPMKLLTELRHDVIISRGTTDKPGLDKFGYDIENQP